MFKYQFNNFLHTQVEQCVYTILTNPPTEADDKSDVHPLLDHVSRPRHPLLDHVSRPRHPLLDHVSRPRHPLLDHVSRPRHPLLDHVSRPRRLLPTAASSRSLNRI